MSGLPNGHATPAAVLAEDATPGRNSDLERFVFLLGGALFSPARDNPGRWPGSAALIRSPLWHGGGTVTVWLVVD